MKRQWTEAEIAHVKEHYQSTPKADLCATLDVSQEHLFELAQSLGLTRAYKKKEKPPSKAAACKERRDPSDNMPPLIIQGKAFNKAVKAKGVLPNRDNTKGQKLLRIDARTQVYVPKGATAKEIADIVAKYTNPNR